MEKYKPIPPFTEDQLRSLWSLIDRRGPDECWPWLGGTTRGVRGGGRYGLWEIRAAGKTFRLRPHRVVFTLLSGPIPEGLTLDHVKELCTNTLCCNPSHLEPVTQSVNSMRRTGATETICAGGHPREQGKRCKICHREACRRYNAKIHHERKSA